MTRLTTLAFILSFLAIITSTLAATQDETRIGRFMTVNNVVQDNQVDPLLQTFQITFPASIETVDDAVNFILINTGYKFSPSFNQTEIVQELLKQPLPLSVRSIGPVSVKDALLALAGDAYQLVIDPAHRLITFRLKPKYQSIYKNTKGGLS